MSPLGTWGVHFKGLWEEHFVHAVLFLSFLYAIMVVLCTPLCGCHVPRQAHNISSRPNECIPRKKYFMQILWYYKELLVRTVNDQDKTVASHSSNVWLSSSLFGILNATSTEEHRNVLLLVVC